MGYKTVSTLVRVVYGLHLIYRRPAWGRLKKERHYTVTKKSLVAHHCLFRMGPRYGHWVRSVNCLRWLRIVCVDIRALWCPAFLQQFLWMVSTDPIGVWGQYANPLTAWFLGVAHYVDGSRWFQSLVGDASTTCCVWHIETSGTLCSAQAGSQHTHCPVSVDDGEALASCSLLEWSVSAMSSLHVITDVQMCGLIKPHKWKCPILSQFH